MSKKVWNHSEKSNTRKKLEKKPLRMESLEDRQLLSAVTCAAPSESMPIEVSAPAFDVACVNFAAASEEAPSVMMADDAATEPTVSSYGTKITVNFAAEQGWCTAKISEVGSEKSTFRNFKVKADGNADYNYYGAAGKTYDISIYQGKFTAKNIGDTEAIAEVQGIAIATPKLAAEKAFSTEDSVTFKATKLYSEMLAQQNEFNLDTVEIYAKLNGAKSFTNYTIQDGVLYDGEDVTDFTIEATPSENNDAVTFTIAGLNTHSMQTIRMGYEYDGAVTPLSNTIFVSTTKAQQTEPGDVAAVLTEGSEASSIDVTWTGEKGVTYTIAYTYKLNGKDVTRTVMRKATVSPELVEEPVVDPDPETPEEIEGDDATYVGKYTISRLAANTEYTVSVTANGDKDHDASVPVAADAVTTFAAIPSALLRKVAVTDTTATIQIMNWNKMSETLEGEDANGEVVVSYGEGDEAVNYTFNYVNLDEGGDVDDGGDVISEIEGEEVANWGWVCNDNPDSILVVAANGKTADLVLTGLEANTNYAFVVSTSAENAVGSASKNLKVKTAISAYSTVEEITASEDDTTANSIAIEWTAASVGDENPIDAAWYTVTYAADGAKARTVSVKGTSTTLKNLNPNTNYSITVAAKADRNGSAGVASEAIEVKTLEKLVAPKISVASGEEGDTFVINTGVDLVNIEDLVIDAKFIGNGKGSYTYTNDKDEECTITARGNFNVKFELQDDGTYQADLGKTKVYVDGAKIEVPIGTYTLTQDEADESGNTWTGTLDTQIDELKGSLTLRINSIKGTWNESSISSKACSVNFKWA